jgi:hypothetical protein
MVYKSSATYWCLHKSQAQLSQDSAHSCAISVQCVFQSVLVSQLSTDIMPNYNSHLHWLTVQLTEQPTNYLIILIRPRAGQSRVQILVVRGRIFFLLQNIHNSSGTHPASYAKGTRNSLLRVKQPCHEVTHSPPSSAKVKNEWNCISTSPIRLHCMYTNLLFFSKSEAKNFFWLPWFATQPNYALKELNPIVNYDLWAQLNENIHETWNKHCTNGGHPNAFLSVSSSIPQQTRKYVRMVHFLI